MISCNPRKHVLQAFRTNISFEAESSHFIWVKTSSRIKQSDNTVLMALHLLSENCNLQKDRVQSNSVLFEAFSQTHWLINRALCLANGMVLNILFPSLFLSIQRKSNIQELSQDYEDFPSIQNADFSLLTKNWARRDKYVLYHISLLNKEIYNF